MKVENISVFQFAEICNIKFSNFKIYFQLIKTLAIKKWNI